MSYKLSSVSSRVPISSSELGRNFAVSIATGKSLVVEMAVAVRSGGEVSDDYKFIYVPMAEGADVGAVAKRVQAGQCASDEIVQVKKIHNFSVDGKHCPLSAPRP